MNHIVRWAWASAALAAGVLGLVGYGMVSKRAVLVSSVPTLFGGVAIGRQAATLYVVRQGATPEAATKAFNSLMLAVIFTFFCFGLAAVFQFLLPDTSAGWVIVFAALFVVELAVALFGARAIERTYPRTA